MPVRKAKGEAETVTHPRQQIANGTSGEGGDWDTPPPLSLRRPRGGPVRSGGPSPAPRDSELGVPRTTPAPRGQHQARQRSVTVQVRRDEDQPALSRNGTATGSFFQTVL